MRPKGLVCVLTLPLAGYGWAHWDRALEARALGDLLVVLLAWAAFHVGSMWLNAFLDQDETRVIFGAIHQAPRALPFYAAGCLMLGVLLCFYVSVSIGLLGMAVAFLAWMYSAEGIAWKGHPVLGPLVNALGYGVLSPVAGWWIVDVTVNARTLVTWWILFSSVMATFYCLQGYQYEEDRERGYQTLVVTGGPVAALRVGRIFIILGLCTWSVLLVLGWYPRVTILVVPVWIWWERWIASWSSSARPDVFLWPLGYAKRAFWVGIIAMGLIGGVYVIDSLRGHPVAGLATASGHPE